LGAQKRTESQTGDLKFEKKTFRGETSKKSKGNKLTGVNVASGEKSASML